MNLSWINRSVDLRVHEDHPDTQAAKVYQVVMELVNVAPWDHLVLQVLVVVKEVYPDLQDPQAALDMGMEAQPVGFVLYNCSIWFFKTDKFDDWI